MELLFVIICSIVNVARGERLFNTTSSTMLGRTVSMWCIATLCWIYTDDLFVYPIVWLGLILWSIPAWDNYWSAAIGNPTDITKKAFKPVDLLMKHFAKLPVRAWGAIAMGLRGFLCAYPLFIFLACVGYPLALAFGLGFLLQGMPYYLIGLQKKKDYVIAESEAAWGACMGIIFYYTLSVN